MTELLLKTFYPCTKATDRSVPETVYAKTQECQAKAMYQYPVDPSGGYLQINDDTFINLCGMVHLARDKLW
jgi:hypothetical protein